MPAACTSARRRCGPADRVVERVADLQGPDPESAKPNIEIAAVVDSRVTTLCRVRVADFGWIVSVHCTELEFDPPARPGVLLIPCDRGIEARLIGEQVSACGQYARRQPNYSEQESRGFTFHMKRRRPTYGERG